MKYYLAHPTKERYFVKEMIQTGLEDEGFEIVNPFESDEDRKRIFLGGDENDDLLSIMSQEMENVTASMVVEDEVHLLRNADGLIAYVPYESMGAAMEIVLSSIMMHDREGTFIFVDVNDPDKEYLKYHPWLQHFGTICTSFEELVKRVREYESRQK